MKNNQNDLIIAIVAGVFAIGFVAGFFFTKREPVQPAAAPAATLTTPVIPAGAIPMQASLDGGSGGAAGGGMMGGRGGRGGAAMMGGAGGGAGGGFAAAAAGPGR